MKHKLLFYFTLFTTLVSFSQSLDPNFGPNSGIVTTTPLSYSVSNDFVRAATLQADGKIVVVGRTWNGSGAGYIARFTATEILDTSFNFCGFRYLPSAVNAIAIQPDGKIIIAFSNAIYRLNTDGTTDTTFTSPNLTTFSALQINEIAINNSGKIIFTGNYSNGTDTDLIVGSLNSDGSLTTSFDTDGIAVLNLPGTSENGYNLKITPTNGKITICGTKAISSTDSDFFITRYTSTGALDIFGTNGVLTFDYGTNDALTSMDFQSDGKLIVVGTSRDTPGIEYLIARRINTNGTIDTTLNFNRGGFRKYYNGSSAINRSEVKIIASDKIAISGSSYLAGFGTSTPAVIQLDANGNYDSSFVGSASYCYCDAYDGNFSYTGFLLQRPDGSYIVGATSYDTSNYKIRLVNFAASGSYVNDTNINLLQGTDKVVSMIEQTNGKTVALLSSEQQSVGTSALLVRYNSNGNIDTLFGADNSGLVDTGLVNPYRLAKQTDGKILVVSTDGLIKRFTADGYLDTGFANSGVLDFSPTATNGAVSFIDNIVTSSDGKIYIVFDYTTVNNLYNIGLYRLNNDGSIDTTFGVDGIATTRYDIIDANEAEWPTDAFLQSDNKIVMACSINNNGNWIGGIVRFNATGTLDTTFGINGKVTAQTGTYYYPYTIKSTQNNKFLIDARISNTRLLTQFNSDGSYDTSFGTNGSVTIPYSSGDMVLQPDGKILCSANGGILRFSTNGTLDTGFGTNGTLTTSIYTNYNHVINKLLWTQNGKLLEGGYTFTGSKYIGALIRYTDIALGTLDFAVAENKILVYPNPIESEATFSYTLEEDSVISITVTDMMGRVVKTIRSYELQNSGNYKQKVALGEMASGNYLLVFSSPKGTQSIKLIKKS
ncbi:Delta-60 repeat [Flavobacteriaceae bacterium]